MKKIDISEAAEFLAAYKPKASSDPVVLMRGRKPIAVVVPTGNADLETISLCYSPAFHAILERSHRSLQREGGVSLEEIQREFGLPPFANSKQEKGGQKPSRSRGSKSGATSRKLNAAK